MAPTATEAAMRNRSLTIWTPTSVPCQRWFRSLNIQRIRMFCLGDYRTMVRQLCWAAARSYGRQSMGGTVASTKLTPTIQTESGTRQTQEYQSNSVMRPTSKQPQMAQASPTPKPATAAPSALLHTRLNVL